ncbi:ABC transporter ATP-binding protein [Photobacterium sp. DNB23_23_1]|uniref:Sn-glycerol-3-phosphate ABC transporter ATP-binding protein UgpC n=1 Tax=Photobacterium pectinilyticum TaxID=2906793 RepID=A0ABT1N1X0_9GAMM|nr:sn-glycerol-3-phosphate ABC transporter ATP-binding protein UgpC [Photobacterium sp. ZSDE20]MCQ1058732.1 sn-glycerol-3-phosphate ABC transporter ATP-binding protein UgpC [Photobacterium sp. ZSDE20]MDD1823514.1 sn-glycerol-3-phosphate ABC transporter ATP-binding protein UgpC [Photobacterium sp. ZSDE20]
MTKLAINNLTKAYGDNVVIPKVDLDIHDGEFVVFVGPSGCGKSTLLRMIAGLESISGGEIKLNGKCLNGIHPSEREVAMVFQSYALYPHMTVEKNMGFPLKMAGTDKSKIAEKVSETAGHLQLDALLKRLPGELSGGQRQRVAIGRAIVRDPELFLFDEPLSNLDAKLRGEMRVYLKQLHQQLNATMVYVTHDQVEAMTLADKIVVLNKGEIEQVGAPEELYNQPVNRFVAAFIGTPVMNFLPVDTLSRLVPKMQVFDGTESVGIRPNQVSVCPQDYDCEMLIKVVEPLGHARLYYGELGGETFVVESDLRFEQGDKLPLNLSQSVSHFFDHQEQRIESKAIANAA